MKFYSSEDYEEFEFKSRVGFIAAHISKDNDYYIFKSRS